MTDSYKARIDEALEALVRASEGVPRASSEGQLIERLGCILAGRKSAWWPKDDGSMPEFNYIYAPDSPPASDPVTITINPNSIRWDQRMKEDAAALYRKAQAYAAHYGG